MLPGCPSALDIAVWCDLFPVLKTPEIAKHVASNRQHFDEKMDALEKNLTKLFASAFPNGDPIGHRNAHEAQIKSADWWSRMKTETFLNLAKSGAWVAVMWVAYAAWEHFKEAVRK